MNNEELILSRLDAKTLVREKWGDGRETACLLAALAPETAEYEDPSVCPADVMPEWLAHLTVWIDDSGTDGAWSGAVRLYAGLAGRWHVLDADGWQRAEWRVKRAILGCMPGALRKGSGLTAITNLVVGLLDRLVAGETVSYGEWMLASNAVDREAREALDEAENGEKWGGEGMVGLAVFAATLRDAPAATRSADAASGWFVVKARQVAATTIAEADDIGMIGADSIIVAILSALDTEIANAEESK